MSNAQNYFTEYEAESVLLKHPRSLREKLNALKVWGMWLYPVDDVVKHSRHINKDEPAVISYLDAFNKAKTLYPRDLNFHDWCNLKDAMKFYWPKSKERLYQVSIRADLHGVREENRVRHTMFNFKNLFFIEDLTR